MSFTSSRKTLVDSGSWSLALRLTTWYVGSSFAILLIATIGLYLILIANLRHEQDQFLDDKTAVLRDMLERRQGVIPDLKEEVEQTWAPRQFARVYARVVGPDGDTIVESPHMSERVDSISFPTPVSFSATPGEGVSLTSKMGKPMRVLAAQTRIAMEGDRIGVIQLALDTETARDLMQGYRRKLLLVLGAGLASCGFAGYWLARAGLKPLRQIAATARRISSTNLSERLILLGLPAELSSVGHRFNDMLDRLEDSFSRLSRFSADIAHELRTPINNLRISAEVALGRARSVEEYRETLGSCLEECERLGRIIDSLLFIARSENPQTHVAREPVNVSRELERIREVYQEPAADAGVNLLVTCAPDIAANLDRTLFQRAVSNLIGNAIRYTPAGGKIAVTAARDNGELRLDVADTGKGIAPDALPHIFDRFYRADPSRANTAGNVGLGLAIVKSIVTLHGGTISARSTLNVGTTMSIRLPALSASPPRVSSTGAPAKE